jgi:hypothetical protein
MIIDPLSLLSFLESDVKPSLVFATTSVPDISESLAAGSSSLLDFDLIRARREDYATRQGFALILGITSMITVISSSSPHEHRPVSKHWSSENSIDGPG